MVVVPRQGETIQLSEGEGQPWLAKFGGQDVGKFQCKCKFGPKSLKTGPDSQVNPKANFRGAKCGCKEEEGQATGGGGAVSREGYTHHNVHTIK